MTNAPPTSRPSRIGRLARALNCVENGVLATLLGAMILLAGGQVAMRNLFGTGFTWTDPMTRLLVLWVSLVGAMVASRNDQHINMDVLSRWLPEWLQRATGAVTGFFTFGVCSFVAYHAARFIYLDYKDGLTAFGLLPAWIVEAIIPFGFSVIALRYLLHCFHPRRDR